MEYTKEFNERKQLLDQLIDRGLEVPDRSTALTFLTRVGYFRSGAYRYVLREFLPAADINTEQREYRSDKYISGASFNHVIRLEAFDSKLARVCLEGLLDFEVRVRAAIAHTLARRNVAAHTLIDCLDANICSRPAKKVTKFDAWMETCEKAIRSAAEDEDFVRHHLLKYPEHPVPIWAVTEALSFGSLPFLFELMKSEDRRAVARSFGFKHPHVFGTVLRMMIDLRNVCAHGSRLFNRVFKRALELSSHEVEGKLLQHIVGEIATSTPKPQRRFYVYVATLAFMLRSHVASTNWHLSLKTQVRKLDLGLLTPDGVPVVSCEQSMGFPAQWEQLPLWAND